MGIDELIADFASRHKVEDLVVVDGAAALDIDGIIVTIVAKDEVLWCIDIHRQKVVLGM